MKGTYGLEGKEESESSLKKERQKHPQGRLS